MLREVADATPGVERVLPRLPPIPVPYWLCTHRELYTSRRTRVTFDFLAEALSGDLSSERRRPGRAKRRPGASRRD
jgi:hypothetical protein